MLDADGDNEVRKILKEMMKDNVINAEKGKNQDYDTNMNCIQVPNKVAHVSCEVITENNRMNIFLIFSMVLIL